MEVQTNFGKFWGGQVQSGQICRGSVRTKGAFSGSGLPYHCPGSSQTLLAVNCIGNHGRVESKELLCTSRCCYTTFPLIHQISLFLDLFEGEVITGSSLAVLLFLWVSKEVRQPESSQILYLLMCLQPH